MKRQPAIPGLLAVAVLAFAGTGLAERGDDTNRKSKNGKASGEIDGVSIEMEYGRPRVNDRKIWGGLVPWDQVWRTGADEATTISFDRDILIDGESLPAGRYGFFTIPGMESWTLIFNDTPDQWGAFSYADAEDALRVRVTPAAGDHVEILTFAVEGKHVALRWETVVIRFEVAAGGG